MALFLFCGEDTYSQQRKLALWRREFEKKHGDLNISLFDGKNITTREILESAQAVPFLSEKRLIIVRNFLSQGKDDEQAALGENLESIPDFTILVFSEMDGVDKRTSLYKKLVKLKALQEFVPITGTALLAWITQAAHTRGVEIESDARHALVEVVGSDLARLENEISKLAGFASGRSITKNDVDLLVKSHITTSIFKLTDGIGQKNRSAALTHLHTLIDSGEDLYMMLPMITRQFRILVCVKDLMDQGKRKDEMIRELQLHPFVISNTMMQARNFTFEQLRRAYSLLVELDTQIKTGGIRVLAGDNRELVLALDRLVISLCTTA